MQWTLIGLIEQGIFFSFPFFFPHFFALSHSSLFCLFFGGKNGDDFVFNGRIFEWWIVTIGCGFISVVARKMDSDDFFSSISLSFLVFHILIF